MPIDKKTENRLISAARRVSRFHPARVAAKKKRKVEKATFVCDKCGHWIYEGKSRLTFEMLKAKYPQHTVRMVRYDIDHISPVVPVEKTGQSISWDEYYDRMFCEEENFQGLCSEPCHKEKTQKEKTQRLAHKYGKKVPK